MTQWQIDPHGVRAVLDAVASEAHVLDEQTGPAKFTQVLDGLAGIPARLSAVTHAVNEALGAQAGNVRAVKDHVSAGQVGVASAAAYYDAGQNDMAAVMQDQAAHAATSGDFTYFTQGARS